LGIASKNPFKYFKNSPEIIHLAVMFYVRYPLSYRQVEDILHERGIDICHETVRFLGWAFWVEICERNSKEEGRAPLKLAMVSR
jgi:transposase-like protein